MEENRPVHRKDRPKKLVWPSLVLAIIWWGLLGWLIVWVDPTVVADFGLPGSYLLFLILAFLAIFYTAGLLLRSKRRGVWVGLGAVVFLWLRLKGIGNILNLILLGLLLFSIEVYLSARR